MLWRLRGWLLVCLVMVMACAIGDGAGDDGASGEGSESSGMFDPGDSEHDTCASDAAAASNEPKDVDIIFVIDNSGSMYDEIDAVVDNINDNFAAIIEASGIDYRVIMLTLHANTEMGGVCVEAPLSTKTSGCSVHNPGPPGNNPNRFFHYSYRVLSLDSLCKVLDTFDGTEPDEYGLAPNGWREWLRPEALKVFIEVTDETTACFSEVAQLQIGHVPNSWVYPQYTDSEAQDVAAQFDAALTTMSPQHFGTPDAPNYVFYSIVGLDVADPNVPTVAHEPDDAVVDDTCFSAVAPAKVYQWLSKNTQALRFPVCHPEGYDSVFNDIATGVIHKARVPCEFAFPDVPGETIDPRTIKVEYTPGGGEPVTFEHVQSSGYCKPDAFYVDGDTIKLCPKACELVSGDEAAAVKILYGCEQEHR